MSSQLSQTCNSSTDSNLLLWILSKKRRSVEQRRSRLGFQLLGQYPPVQYSPGQVIVLLRFQLRKRYIHQFNIYLGRISCINSVSISVKKGLLLSIQNTLRSNSLHESSFYFTQGGIIFINSTLYLRRLVTFDSNFHFRKH